MVKILSNHRNIPESNGILLLFGSRNSYLIFPEFYARCRVVLRMIDHFLALIHWKCYSKCKNDRLISLCAYYQ